MVVSIKVDGLELEIAGDSVKYAVEGRWHHCSLDDFEAMLDRHFRPRKQEEESP